MSLKKRDLEQLIRTLGYKEATDHLVNALKTGQLKPEDFSLRDVAESFIRDRNMNAMGSDMLASISGGEMEVDRFESNAVSTSTDGFSALNGQIIYQKTMSAYLGADRVLSPMIPEIQAIAKEGDKIPGVSGYGPAPLVAEGGEIPKVGPTQNYVYTGPIQKRGYMTEITWEEVRFDRTFEVYTRCTQVGESIKLAEELQFCNLLAATAGSAQFPTTPYFYNWLNPVANINPYRTSVSGNLNWINDITSGNPLIDNTNLNNINLLLDNILDPITGYPMQSPPGPLQLVVTPTLAMQAERIQTELQLRTGVGSGTSPQLITGESTRNLPRPFEVKVSKHLGYVHTAASIPQTTWYWYNPAAFIKTVAMQQTEADAVVNSGRFFDRDLAFGKRALAANAYTWYEPRWAGRSAV